MRITNIQRVAGAALVLGGLAACGGPARQKTNAPAITKQYGAVSALAKKEAQAEKGVAFTRYVGALDKPNELWSGYVTADEDEIFVVDAALTLESEYAVPKYKLRIYPRDTPREIVEGWPQYADGYLRLVNKGAKLPFVAPLPKERIAGPDGYFETDWVFCPSCAGLSESSDKVIDNSLNSLAQRFADRSSGQVEFGSIAFKPETTRSYFKGEKAAARVAELTEEKAAAAARAEKYAEPRKAYRSFADNARKSGLVGARKEECGSLSLKDPPRPRWDDRNAARKFESRMEDNAERFEKHVECVAGVLEGYDYAARASEIVALRAEEAEKWEAAAFDSDKGRYDVPDLEKEVAAEEAYLERAQKRFEDLAGTYERAWDNYVAESEREARRVAERRREREIERQVKRCIAGLYAQQALTPYSRGFCKSQAEKGIDGLQAAIIGGAGASGGGGGASTPNPVLHMRPELPKFDLQGMIANARAAADRNDPGLLFDEGGGIRTSMAPELMRSSGSARSGGLSGGSSSVRRTSADRPSSPDSRGVSKARSAASEAMARAEKAAGDAEQVAMAETAPPPAPPEPEIASRYTVSFVKDSAMRGNAVNLIHNGDVDVPGLSEQGRVGALDFFVLHDDFACPDGVMQAQLGAVIGAIWNTMQGTSTTPKPGAVETVKRFERRAASDRYFGLEAWYDGSNSGSHDAVKAAVGSRYKGRAVAWANTTKFKRLAEDNAPGCKEIAWAGGSTMKLPIR